ncbi:MAG: hypothetical protein SVR94_03080 [Pseudomonadota bacterium]|nr:hypothetical protein [Pseudomonadota bacterium]
MATGFVPLPISRYFLVVAFSLIATLAVLSHYNAHPDEAHHFQAARYYFDHWLPPKVGDPEIRDSYSRYGLSYLHSLGIDYLLAGKLATLILPVVPQEIIAVRCFNVLLFLLLLIIFFRRSQQQPSQLIPLIVVLFTPQVWYIFGYINNDAFPLFLSLLIISEITYPQSPLNRFLAAETYWPGGILFGVLLGIVLISKMNYFVFLGGIGLLVLYELISIEFKKYTPKLKVDSQRFLKYLMILGVSVVVVSGRYSVEIAVHGWDKRAQVIAYKEQISPFAFKPSTRKQSPQQTFFASYLKEKGLKYSQLFTQWHWHKKIFESFVGVYGYMSIRAQPGYYQLMQSLYAGLGFLLIASIVLSYNKRTIALLFITLITVTTMILISSYHAWSNDFQAQGRYLFPVIGFLGLLMYQSRQHLNHWGMNAFILCLFSMSMYSFLLFALPRTS